MDQAVIGLKHLLLIICSAISSGTGISGVSNDSVCFLSPNMICSSNGFPGVRFYYSTSQQKCKEHFFFTDCAGNSFPTLEACQCECESTCSEDTTSPSPRQVNSTTEVSTTEIEVTPRTISMTTETTNAPRTSLTQTEVVDDTGIPKTSAVRTTRQWHTTARHTSARPKAVTTVPLSTPAEHSTQDSPALNSYGYVVVAIGMVVIVLMVTALVLTAMVMWRVIRQRTKIMNKEEPVALANFTEGIPSSQRIKMEAAVH